VQIGVISYQCDIYFHCSVVPLTKKKIQQQIERSPWHGGILLCHYREFQGTRLDCVHDYEASEGYQHHFQNLKQENRKNKLHRVKFKVCLKHDHLRECILN
jgi:hypothetical protein